VPDEYTTNAAWRKRFIRVVEPAESFGPVLGLNMMLPSSDYDEINGRVGWSDKRVRRIRTAKNRPTSDPGRRHK